MNNDEAIPVSFWLLMGSLIVLTIITCILVFKAMDANINGQVQARQDYTYDGKDYIKGNQDNQIANQTEHTATGAAISDSPDFASNAGNSVSISNVSYNINTHHVTGSLSAPGDAGNYRAVLFIRVSGQYYIKPSMAGAGSILNKDLTFDIQAYTDDGNKHSDQTADMISVYIVPANFDFSAMQDYSDTQTVKGASLSYIENIPTGQ